MSNETKPSFFQKWGAIAGTVTTALTLMTAIFVFDDRYAKHDAISGDIEKVKEDIISEMRLQISKNRVAMISNMQRDADDLEFMIYTSRQKGEEPLRYIVDKHKQILRDIEQLKSYEKDTN